MCQLSRALGLHHSLSPEGKLRLIAELKAHYRHGLKFGKRSEHRGEKTRLRIWESLENGGRHVTCVSSRV